ncbi:MAG: winged helix DNA-binding domain-containing protein [Pseudomonadota bacterium]
MDSFDFNRVNHFMLRRQHLAQGTRGKGGDVVRVTRDIGGLHATYPLSPYLSAFLRVKGFRKEQLDKELFEKKSLGRVRFVRKTMYILPRGLIAPAFAAIRKMVEMRAGGFEKYMGITPGQYAAAAKKIMKVVGGVSCGLSVSDIKKALGAHLNVSPVVSMMCDEGLLVRGMPRGGWTSNVHCYHVFRDFFPDVDVRGVGEEEARETVVGLYLSTFGPVSEGDVVWWTGFGKEQVRAALARLEKEVVEVDLGGVKDRYFMLEPDFEELRAMKMPGGRSVLLLPCLDPCLMAYKDRQRYLDDEHYHFMYDRSGNATWTIMIGGKVAGVWDYKEPVVKICLFRRKAGAGVLKELRREAVRVGRFISGRKIDVRVKQVGGMIPLTERPAGGFMSPLKEMR